MSSTNVAMSDPAQDAVNGLALAGDEPRDIRFCNSTRLDDVWVCNDSWTGTCPVPLLSLDRGYVDPEAARSLARTLQAWAGRMELRGNA